MMSLSPTEGSLKTAGTATRTGTPALAGMPSTAGTPKTTAVTPEMTGTSIAKAVSFILKPL